MPQLAPSTIRSCSGSGVSLNRDAVPAAFDSSCPAPASSSSSCQPNLRRQVLPHILPRRRQLRALLYQRVRPPRILVRHIPRHRIHIAILLHRAPRRNPRPASTPPPQSPARQRSSRSKSGSASESSAAPETSPADTRSQSSRPLATICSASFLFSFG